MPATAPRSFPSVLLDRLKSGWVWIWPALVAMAGLGPSALRAQTAYFSSAQSSVGSGFSSLTGVAVDASGNVYISDQGTETIYKEVPNGSGGFTRSTVASGFRSLFGVAADASGNVYAADRGAQTVYKETPGSGSYNQSTVASGFSSLGGVAVDASGNVYASDQGAETVYKETPGSGSYTQSTVASSFSSLAGLAVDSSGNLYVADQGAATVYKEAPGSGNYTRSIVASGFSVLAGVAVDPSGNLYVADHGTGVLYREMPDGSGSYVKTTVASGFGGLTGVVADRNSSIYIADAGVDMLQAVGVNFFSAAVGTASVAQPLTFTFTNSTAAEIGAPVALTTGVQNLDFVVSSGGSCNTTTQYGTGATGTCIVDVTFTPQSAGLRMGAVELTSSSGSVIATAYVYGTGSGPMIGFPPGTITLLAGDSGLEGYSGDGFPATSAMMNLPWTTALDGAGNLYIADAQNNVIRKETISTGIMTTVAGNYSLSGTDGGYNGASGTATSLELFWPQGLAIDGAGNLYISDGYNDVIRKVTPSGEMTTIAGTGYDEACGSQTYSGDGGLAINAQLNCPMAIALDGAGNLYIADQEDNAIRKVNASNGIITTVAGNGIENYSGDNGPATQAELNNPAGLAVDSAGDLYIADTYNNRIREVNAATGIITTVAGNGSNGNSGNGVAATSAKLNYPGGVAVDATGDLYIADTNNNIIREVTAGIITTVAGNGTAALNGNDGPATGAELNQPNGLSLDGNGNLYIADTNNNVVRKVNVSGTPALSFATTAAGSTSTDSPKTVTIKNLGNEALIFESDPSISSNFGLESSTCSNTDTIAAEDTCSVAVSFSPTVSGDPLAGSLVLTDNALNATSPAYTTQSVGLSGIALGGLPAVTTLSPYYALVGTSPTITITGSNFTRASAVQFGMYQASSFTVNSDTKITAAPQAASSSGTVNVTVTVGTATSATSTATEFIYYTPLSVVTITAPQMLTGGVGANLTPVTAANGIPAYSYSISPSLPTGLTFNSGTGAISGTPTQAQSNASYTVTVTDAIGESIQGEFTMGVSAVFGSVALGSSITQTISIAFSSSVTLGSAPYKVLTMGAPNLDFTASTTQQTSVCTANQSYSAGNTCTVNVTFMPQYPGLRNGAMQLVSNTGTVVATEYIAGTGTGPQLVFGRPITGVDLAGGFGYPDGVAVDSVGNVYVADANKNAIFEIPVTCINGSNDFSCVTTLGGGFTEPEGVAVDGAGNVYVADYGNSEVKEIPAGCLSSGCVKLLGNGFVAPQGVAVDSSGNVYVADTLNNLVKEIPISCINGSNNAACVITLGGGFHFPFGVALDGGGNVYVADTYNNAVKEIPASCINGSNNSSCVVTLGGGSYGQPASLALDPAGNIYLANYEGNPEILEIPAGCTSANYTAGSCSVTTAFSGNGETYGIALDSAGNLYEGSYGFQSVVFINRNAPENIDFDETNVDSTSADSPELVGVENIGNAALTFPVPSTGSNPNITNSNFTLDSSTTCPVVASGASSAVTLAAGANCALGIDFTPLSAGTFYGSLVLTDTSLDASPSTTQTVTFSGVGVAMVPNAPTGAMATSGNASATVSFVPPSFNGHAAITSYTVTSSPGNITAMGAGSPITVTGLTNGTAYTFTVTAANSVGTSVSSAPSNSVTPYGTNVITFPSLGGQVIFGDVAPPLLNAMATSGLAVSYVVTGPASYVDGYLNIGGPGIVTVTASQLGSNGYPVATPVVQTLTVLPANFTAVSSGAQVQGTQSTVAVTLQFNASFVLGSNGLFVVNNGAPGAPFALATGNTCVGNLSPGSTCTISLTYTPTGPGMITGTVEAIDSNGLIEAATNAVALRSR